MAAKISKRYSYNSPPKAFKLFLDFPPNCPRKTTLGIFEILNIEILMIFLTLLEYVSRAHEIEICPSTCVHPSAVSQFSLNLMHEFLSNFGCCFN